MEERELEDIDRQVEDRREAHEGDLADRMEGAGHEYRDDCECEFCDESGYGAAHYRRAVEREYWGSRGV